MPTIEENSKRVLAVATRKELSGAELADKLNRKYPKAVPTYQARGIARSLSALVKSGRLKKVGSKSRPKYVKA